MNVSKSFSFNAQKHAHILAWLGKQPNQSQAVQMALDAYITGEVRLIDVYRAIQSLKDHLGTVRDSQLPKEEEGEEPADIRNALDHLGGKNANIENLPDLRTKHTT